MNLEIELLKLLPRLFNALDALLEYYSIYLYLVLVWLAVATIAWIISGGLRRKQPRGNFATVIPRIILMAQPPRQPEPPIVDIEVERVWNDDDESMD